jgi:hypothetical protein
MVEAALLAESASLSAAAVAGSGSLSLKALVDTMHDTRGTAAHQEPDRRVGRLLPRSRRPMSLDIPDVHGGEVKSHKPVLEQLRWASSHLAESLVRLAQPKDG